MTFFMVERKEKSMIERLLELKDKSYEECTEILNQNNKKIFFIKCLLESEIQYLRILDDSIIKLIYDADGINTLFNAYEPRLCFEILFSICKFGEELQLHLLNIDEVIDYVLVHENCLDYLLSLLSDNAYNYLQKIITYKKMCVDALCISESVFLEDKKVYESINEFIVNQKDIKLDYKTSDIIHNLINIETYRKLEEKLKYNNNPLKLINDRKKYYDYVINSYNFNTELICIYQDFLDMYFNSSDLSFVTACKFDPFTRILKNTLFDNKDYIILDELKNNKDKIAIVDLLKEKSKDYLVRCIIDYHLMDTYHNMCIEINQLIDYNVKCNIISDDNIFLYSNILSIYNMSIDDLFIFHNSLKKINVPEIIYSDIRKSKNSAYTNILNSLKTNNDITKNDILTDKYGVDTYYLNGESFVGLVKCVNRLVTDVLNKDGEITERTDSASFSLISDKNLYTIYNPLVNYTFLFSDFSIDNIVHMFYSDSFSSYSHDNNALGIPCTRFMNVYNNASDFLNMCGEYNEIVIAQNNVTTDSYNFLKPSPKLSSILCFNEPTNQMIETAKNLNISITIVNKSKYLLNQNTSQYSKNYINKYDPNSPFCYSSDNYRKPYIRS